MSAAAEVHISEAGAARAFPGFLVRLLPSLTDVAFIMPLFYVFAVMQGAPRMLEGDTGWHIRAGEWMLANRRVLDHDIFSFTKPGEQWFAWEWLWDVCFAWLHRQGGMAAVVLASMFVIGLAIALLFRLTRRKCGNAIIAFAVTALAMAASSIHWVSRPHLFTLLFVIIFYSLLERVREGRTRLLLPLPFITILWANLHGGFFVGIFLVCAYGAGEVLAACCAPGPGDRRGTLRRSMSYWFAAAGCAAASLVNPFGWNLHLHILQYLRDPSLFRSIAEFHSVDFQNTLSLYLEPLLLLGIAAAVVNLLRRKFAYCILILAWAHFAVFSVRNVPIFAVLVAPLVAELLEEAATRIAQAALPAIITSAVRRFRATAADFTETDSRPRVHLASLLAVAVVTGLFFAPRPGPKFRAEFDAKSFPVAAVGFLNQLDPTIRIFTNDEWGDYLIYRLYPQRKVFMDGRSDFYGSGFVDDYCGITSVRHDWKHILARYGVGAVLLSPNSPLAGALKESAEWRPVYDDGTAIIFLPAPGTQAGAQVSVVPSHGKMSAVVRPRVQPTWSSDHRDQNPLGKEKAREHLENVLEGRIRTGSRRIHPVDGCHGARHGSRDPSDGQGSQRGLGFHPVHDRRCQDPLSRWLVLRRQCSNGRGRLCHPLPLFTGGRNAI